MLHIYQSSSCGESRLRKQLASSVNFFPHTIELYLAIMVDILVKPGSPKAWSSLQKDLPSNCGFISSHSPPFSLTSFTFDTILAEYPCASTFAPQFKDTSQSRGSRFFRVHKSQAIPRKKKNSHPEICPMMPHSSLSMGSGSPAEISLFASRDSKDVKCIAVSPKPIHSSSGISSEIFGKGITNSETEYHHIKNIEESGPADTDGILSKPGPAINMSWCCQGPPFASKSSNTSSLETSFGMVGTPNEDISINNDLLFPSTSNTGIYTKLSPEESQNLPLHGNDLLWSHRQLNGVDLWRQQYGETSSWDSDYFYNWQSPDLNVLSSDIPPIPCAPQPYIPPPLSANNTPTYIPHSNPQPSTLPSQKIQNTSPGGMNWSYQNENQQTHKYNHYPHPHPHHHHQIQQPSTSPSTLTNSPFTHQPRSQTRPTVTDTSTGTPSSQQSLSSPDSSNRANIRLGDSRNKFLVDCKRRGLSYRAIKHLGGFKEAESTLRGRFRTLTKTKEQRVRKPKWSDTDVSLLHCSLTPLLFP